MVLTSEDQRGRTRHDAISLVEGPPSYIVGNVRYLTAAVEQNTHRHRFVLIFIDSFIHSQNTLLATRRRSCSLSCWGFCISCTDSRFAIWDLSLGRVRLEAIFPREVADDNSVLHRVIDCSWKIDWWCLRLQFIQLLSHWSTKCSFFKHIKHLFLRLRMSLLALISVTLWKDAEKCLSV